MVTATVAARHPGARWGSALASVAVAVAGLSLVAPAAASAAEPTRPTLRTVRTLPFTGTGDARGEGDGGRGRARANAAVAAACNGGAPLSAPQWYAVGSKLDGPIKAVSAGVWYGRGPVEEQSGTAVVDHWTGKVLACTGEVVRRWHWPVDVVGYLAKPYDDQDGQFPLTLTTHITRVPSGPPPNDRMTKARRITSLPFTTTVDTSLADDDGPRLLNYGRCLLSSLLPQQASTAWYRYAPTTTGPAPAVSVRPANGWADANSPGAAGLRTGILELLPDGSTRLVENADDWDCETPVELVAGHTYLIGVFYTWDDYADVVLTTGGPVNLSVKSR